MMIYHGENGSLMLGGYHVPAFITESKLRECGCVSTVDFHLDTKTRIALLESISRKGRP